MNTIPQNVLDALTAIYNCPGVISVEVAAVFGAPAYVPPAIKPPPAIPVPPVHALPPSGPVEVPPASVQPPPVVNTRMAAHLVNIRALYSEGERGQYLAQRYSERALDYSRLEPLIRDGLFGGDQNRYAHFADPRSYLPGFNGPLSVEEFQRILALVNAADRLPL